MKFIRRHLQNFKTLVICFVPILTKCFLYNACLSSFVTTSTKSSYCKLTTLSPVLKFQGYLFGHTYVNGGCMTLRFCNNFMN